MCFLVWTCPLIYPRPNFPGRWLRSAHVLRAGLLGDEEMQIRSLSAATAYAFVALAMTLTLSVHAQTVLDFEDGNLDDWLLLDEAPANLGDQGPGTWEIRNSLLDLDGNALFQGSNIFIIQLLCKNRLYHIIDLHFTQTLCILFPHVLNNMGIISFTKRNEFNI